MCEKKILIRCSLQNRGLYYIATPLFKILNKNNIDFYIWPINGYNENIHLKQIKNKDFINYKISIFFEILDGINDIKCEQILFIPMLEWINEKIINILKCNQKKIKIICPTKCCFNFIKKLNLNNDIYYCPWIAPTDIKNNRFKYKAKNFLLIGGQGINDRKNVELSINAIKTISKKIENECCQFIITSQNNKFSNINNISNNIKIINGDLQREKIINLINWADITINLSRVEGLGIPLLESIFSYTPAITSNCPPMNEIINIDRGWLCDGIITKTNYADSIILNIENISNLIYSILGIEIYEKSKNCAIFCDLITKNFYNFWENILLN